MGRGLAACPPTTRKSWWAPSCRGPRTASQPHSFLKPLLSQLQHLELQFVPNGTGKTVFRWHNGPKSQLGAGDRGHSGMGVLTRVCPQRATIPVSVISAVGDTLCVLHRKQPAPEGCRGRIKTRQDGQAPQPVVGRCHRSWARKGMLGIPKPTACRFSPAITPFYSSGNRGSGWM